MQDLSAVKEERIQVAEYTLYIKSTYPYKFRTRAFTKSTIANQLIEPLSSET